MSAARAIGANRDSIPVYFLREGEHFIISSFIFHLGREGKNWEGGHLITLFLFIIIILLY